MRIDRLRGPQRIDAWAIGPWAQRKIGSPILRLSRLCPEQHERQAGKDQTRSADGIQPWAGAAERLRPTPGTMAPSASAAIKNVPANAE